MTNVCCTDATICARWVNTVRNVSPNAVVRTAVAAARWPASVTAHPGGRWARFCVIELIGKTFRSWSYNLTIVTQGSVCANRCPEGFWGKNCSQICDCYNGAGCDHITGECQCKSGFYGNKVNIGSIFVRESSRCPRRSINIFCFCPFHREKNSVWKSVRKAHLDWIAQTIAPVKTVPPVIPLTVPARAAQAG